MNFINNKQQTHVSLSAQVFDQNSRQTADGSDWKLLLVVGLIDFRTNFLGNSIDVDQQVCRSATSMIFSSTVSQESRLKISRSQALTGSPFIRD